MKILNTALIVASLVASVGFVACSSGTQNKLESLSIGAYALAPQTVSLVLKGYVPQAGNSYQNIFVSNFSVNVSQGQLSYSSSRDGLSDAQKNNLVSTFGFFLGNPESVVTGFTDLLLYDLGITKANQSLMHCAANEMSSSSNDGLTYVDDRQTGAVSQFLGLRDCEKVYMGLNPSLFDNAGNGIPDYLKLRCGINTSSTAAAYVSTAGDGVSNLDKCKRHIPITESASTQPNQLYSYQYSKQLNSDGSTDFTISNIPILNGGSENFIAFYVVETSNASSSTTLTSAYMILKDGSGGKTIQAPYWATSSSKLTNQEIVPQ